MSKKKLAAQDIESLCEKVWSQFKEDRDAIVQQYEHLRKEIHADPNKYVVNGDTLAKYAELMLKQTGQVVELIKLVGKNKPDDGTLTAEDLELISNKIKEEKE